MLKSSMFIMQFTNKTWVFLYLSSYAQLYISTPIFFNNVLQGVVWGHYRITVWLHSIENRGGRCADERFYNGGDGCCESSTCATTLCLYELSYCQILSPLPTRRSANLIRCGSRPLSIGRFENRKKDLADNLLILGSNLVSHFTIRVVIYPPIIVCV